MRGNNKAAKYIRILFSLMMALMLCACGSGNQLADDLDTARKEVEKSEEQEAKIGELISKVTGEEVDMEELSELNRIKDELVDSVSEEAEENVLSAKDSSKKKKKDSGNAKLDFAKYASGDYASLMQNMHYYMEYTSYVWGMEGSGRTAADGSNTDTISEMMGMATRSLLLDGYQYEFDMNNKKYTKTEIGDMEEFLESMGVDYSQMKYSGSGNGPIPGMEEVAGYDGSSYDYDEFSMDVNFAMDGEGEAGTNMSIPIRFYMDGSDLYAVYTQVMGIDSIMIINEMSEKIPDDMLRVPEGYEEVDSLY